MLREVTVVGAGVIGAACALRLVMRGRKVVLIDSGVPGNGCSFGNAGLIGPNAMLPSALPGMLRKVPSWLLKRSGPASTRLRDLPSVLPWFVSWARCANEASAIRSAAALSALNTRALDGYRELLGSQAYAQLVTEAPVVQVSASPFDGATARIVARLRELHSVRAELIDRDALRSLDLGLSGRYTHGVLVRKAAFVRSPRDLVNQLCDLFVAAGGKIVLDEVIRFERRDRRVHAIRTTSGRQSVGNLVIATGAGSGRLLKALGMKFPVIAERGYHLNFPESTPAPSIPVVDSDQKMAATPMDGGLRVTGFAEFVNPAAPADSDKWKTLESMVRRAFPGVTAEPVGKWMGSRASTPDSVPIIERTATLDNLFLATGHGHYGMSGAPGTSLLIADLLDGAAPSIEPVRYSSARFFQA